MGACTGQYGTDKLTEQMSILKADRCQLELELAVLTKKRKRSEWYFHKRTTLLKVQASQLDSPLWCLPSSSPEPRSPSSFTSSSTPISSSSSLKSTPPSCVQISRVHLRSQSYEDDSTMPIPHESDGTVILSSDESSSE